MLHKVCQLAGKMGSRNKLSVLIFHQIMERPDPMRPGEPTVEVFRWQMALLKRYYNPLPLAQAVKLLADNRLPPNSICVTFDDGYLDNLTLAQPVLEEFDIPATVFVATGFSHGENMWNDRLIDLVADEQLTRIDLSPMKLDSHEVGSLDSRRQLIATLIPKLKYLDMQERKSLINDLYKANKLTEKPAKMMTPEQVRLLSDKGVEIGAHTIDHPILMSHSEEQQREQILQSKRTLESWLDKPVRGFAYPNGKPGVDYDEVGVKIVSAGEFDYAVSTTWGVSTQQTNPFELLRFSPWDRTASKYHMRLTRNQLGIL